MAKKRGGIAGFYDRNKKVIKPVAAGLAGMLGTPALGAAVGAAFGGLDREGKRGIGIDLGGAAKGGLSGYAAGSAGSALGGRLGIGKIGGLEKAGGRLSELFTGTGGGGASGAAQSAAAPSPLDKLTGAPGVGLTSSGPTSYGNTGLFDMVPTPSQAPSSGMFAGGTSAPAAGGGRIASAAKKVGGAAKSAGGYLERNERMLGGVAKGVGNVLGGRAEGDAAANKLALEQSQFDYLKQQNEAEEERKRNVAQLISQMFAPQMASMYASGSGTPAMTMQNYMDSTGANATPEEFGPDMMNYINSRPTRPSGPSQGLMNYVNSRR